MASFSRASSVHDMANVVEAKEREPRDQCWQCGKPEHTDKMLADQCRLMTAILGPRWGYDNEAPTKDKRKTVTFDMGVEFHTYEEPGVFDKGWKDLKLRTPVFPVTEEAWREELDLLTRFSPHNWGFIPSTRPRLTKRVNRWPMLKKRVYNHPPV